MSDRPETTDDIIREMREQANEPTIVSLGEVFPPVGTEDVKDWADRIEAAVERERNRQYEPKCNWSIKDALALANTLANHGLRDGNADAASSCIYSLCRILSSHGNAAALRRALEDTEELLEHFAKPGTMLHSAFFLHMRDNRAALAAPPRNCDRFQTASEVSAYWNSNVRTVPLPHDAYGMHIDGETYPTFLDWLFAKAEGGEK